MKKINEIGRNWFEEWFNSPYYHILYKNRDEAEARHFIDNISLSIKKNAKILDLGCGRGRHSVYLSQKGFDVTGIDISPQNILYAGKLSNSKVSFYVHDMRQTFKTNYFDCVMNLFTSFGYFEKDGENRLIISSVSKSLKPNGCIIMDFMNSEKVIENLVGHETKNISGIRFKIHRHIEDGFIVKRINIQDKGKAVFFRERVKALTLPDFINYFDSCGFKIINLYGDYSLNKFDVKTSDRLILIGRKII